MLPRDRWPSLTIIRWLAPSQRPPQKLGWILSRIFKSLDIESLGHTFGYDFSDFNINWRVCKHQSTFCGWKFFGLFFQGPSVPTPRGLGFAVDQLLHGCADVCPDAWQYIDWKMYNVLNHCLDVVFHWHVRIVFHHQNSLFGPSDSPLKDHGVASVWPSVYVRWVRRRFPPQHG